MALCKEPLASLASCSSRIAHGFSPNLQKRENRPPTARFFPNKGFARYRAVRIHLRNDATAFRTRFRDDVAEWQIRVLNQEEFDSGSFQRFYATCENGLEEILAAELSSPLIGAVDVEGGSCGGVSFLGTQSTGYNANLWLRTGGRVLCELARGSLLLPKGGGGGTRFSHELYEFVREVVDWRLVLVDDGAGASQSDHHGNDGQALPMCAPERYRFRKFSVQTRFYNCNEIKDRSSVSTSISNAIWDALRDACGGRWPESPERGDEVGVPLILHVNRDEAILYRDMSGISLLDRGYRDSIDKVKSKEGLAAAILTIAGWNHMVPGYGDANKNKQVQEKDRVFLDPFCGTGTILIQAALMACNVAPGLMRRRLWPFQTWHDYDQRSWTQCKDAAASMQVSSPSGARLIGNDMNNGNIAKCKRAARAAGVLHLLDLSCEASRHYRPPFTPSLVVTNPPSSAPLTYSSLRGEDERLLTLWQGFGQFLKSQCRGADVYVLSESDCLSQAIRLLPDRKWDMQPDKQWRGRLTGRKADQIFGSQERKLLHYHVHGLRDSSPQNPPFSALPFSSLSPTSSKL